MARDEFDRRLAQGRERKALIREIQTTRPLSRATRRVLLARLGVYTGPTRRGRHR